MGAEETRERILVEASRLFAARGFDGTTTRALAQAAGVNVATLAWHFGDKRGLYHAVLDGMYEKLLELRLPEDLPTDRRQRVRVFAAAALRFALDNRETVRLLSRHVIEEAELPEPVRERWTGRLIDGSWAPLQELGLPPDRDWRLPLLSLNHLVVRYALSDEADIALFTDREDPFAAVVEHVQDVACLLLCVGGEP